MDSPTGSGLPVKTTAQAIGGAIRVARREAGLTQAQLSELAGVSERTLRDIEKGRGGSTLGAVTAVAEALGLRIEARR